MSALEIVLEGRVQGVGFRPFVWNLAKVHGVAGWVGNTARGVAIHAEADGSTLQAFSRAVAMGHPEPAWIRTRRETVVQALGLDDFRIRESDPSGEPCGSIVPDLCMCESCRRELFDPSNRRFAHPFITCSRCGPRFSIIEDLPYDRPSTSMRRFPMCPECLKEYEDPQDRRFHAQPISCPRCGPRMWCEARSGGGGGHWRRSRGDWLEMWTENVSRGGVSLVKGVGGFHLVCDMADSDAVRLLRERKRRETKPFAIMAPDLDSVRAICRVGREEEALLTGSERPIVLLDVHAPPDGMEWIAPGLRQLGVMLPHAPVHELFFSRFPRPVVLTSANRGGEPMPISNGEAREIADEWCDLLVLHDRGIVNRVDDGVVAAVPESEQVVSLRVGRGGSPKEFFWDGVGNCLAMGADLKNAVAFSRHGRVTLSQHIGDMEHPATQDAACEMVERLCRSHRAIPEFVACDAHPDFDSSRMATRFSSKWRVPVYRIQHHHAHIASAWLEHRWEGDAIGLAMDGTGYGDSDCIWGSEAMYYTAEGSTTLGHFQGMRLPGGDLAVRQPARLLIGALHDTGDAELLDAWMELHAAHRALYDGGLKDMLECDMNCPPSRGAGRLFDLVGAMLGWSDPGWDGEMGTRLEHLDVEPSAPSWPVERDGGRILLAPILRDALRDVLGHCSAGWVSSRLHATIAEAIVQMGEYCETTLGEAEGALPWAFAGGVFQNRRIVVRVRSHRRIGSRKCHFASIPNDNGIALGQIVAATALACKGVAPCA